MLEPGYEALLDLGISDLVNNRLDISKAVLKYSRRSIREPKLRKGIDFLQRNKPIVDKMVNNIYIHQKKREP